MTTKSFQFRGDLAQTTLPEMLSSIYRFQVPGIIEAQRDGVTKQVYLKEGNILHASSSDIDDSLGAYLLRTERITREQFDATMREREKAEQRYGVILIERKILSPEEVYAAIREQVEAIVWSLFYWQDGEVSFRIGDFQVGGMVRILLPMRQVILAGIKRAPDARALVARLGRKETVFEPCFNPDELVEIALDRDEYEVLRQVDGESNLYEICTHGSRPPADTAKLLYAFQVLGLIRQSGESPVSRKAPDRDKITIRFRTEGDLQSSN